MAAKSVFVTDEDIASGIAPKQQTKIAGSPKRK
jgi:hypothetical protein